MAKIPRFTASSPGSAGSGLARATDIGALTQTGAGTIARAVTGAGRAVQQTSAIGSQVLQIKQEAEADLQFDTVTVNAKDFISQQQQKIKLEKVKSLKEQKQLIDKNALDFKNFMTNQMLDVSPLARKQLQAYMADALPVHKDRMRQVTSASLADFTVTEGMKNIDALASSGDSVGALERLEKLRLQGYITDQEAAAKEADVIRIVKRAAIENIKPGLVANIESGGFDPSGSGFDIVTSKASGAKPDQKGHLGSLDPRTGMLLKGINHPTIDLTFKEEERLGNKIVFKNGRFFSVSKDSKGKGLTLLEAQQIDTEVVIGKEAAIDFLNSETDRLTEQGVLSEPEAAQANKILGDWIDNFVAGRFKQASDAEKLTTIETYRELSDPIVKSDLTYDDIDQSSLLKADKQKWFKYIKGSYKDAPEGNTPDGHTASFAAVYDAATLQLSPKEAYDNLLELRFVKKSITDDQFKWGVDKIENPYPAYMIENINSTMKANLEEFNRTFNFSDNKRNKKVNESLQAWIDNEIKEGRSPTKKEMYGMSSQYRVGNDRWFDVGQVIIRGGREWEVVGFDENDEPVVEEIQ